MNLRKKRLEDAIDDILAAMAGWMNRKQQDVIAYLYAENEILKEQLETKGVKLKLSNGLIRVNLVRKSCEKILSLIKRFSKSLRRKELYSHMTV